MIGWLIVGACLVWLALAAGVAVAIGRAIRVADRERARVVR